MGRQNEAQTVGWYQQILGQGCKPVSSQYRCLPDTDKMDISVHSFMQYPWSRTMLCTGETQMNRTYSLSLRRNLHVSTVWDVVIEFMSKELPEQRQREISDCSVSKGITTGWHLSLVKWTTRKQGWVFHLDRKAEKWQVWRHEGPIVLTEMKWDGMRGDKVVWRERKGYNLKDKNHGK